VRRALAIVRALLARDGRLTGPAQAGDERTTLFALMQEPEARRLTNVNAWQGETYFNKEAFESLIAHLLAAELVLSADDRSAKAATASAAAGKRAASLAKDLLTQAAADGYRVLPPIAVVALAKATTVPSTAGAPTRPVRAGAAKAVKATPSKAKPAKPAAKRKARGSAA
jgi:hypothetical protein